MKIEDAIQQPKFKNDYQKTVINILYSAAWLNQLTTQSLRPFEISWQQFNIMRILRGLGDQPATVKLLTERMIDKMSNASRLVDKLVQKGYVERNNSTVDRRRVDIYLTAHGKKVLNEASKLMEAELENNMATLTQNEARRLSDLLDKMRIEK